MIKNNEIKIRRGPAGKGRFGGFTFKVRTKYNRKRNKESRERF